MLLKLILWKNLNGSICYRVKSGSHISPTYLRRSCRLQLITVGDLFQLCGPPTHLRWIADDLNLHEYKLHWSISTIPPLNMDRFV